MWSNPFITCHGLICRAGEFFPVRSLLVVLSGLSIGVNADLLSRLEGQAVYDSDLNITWLADAGGAGSPRGLMTWAEAQTWVAGFSLGGATEWRLPSTSNPDVSCDDAATSSGFNCTGSEMGHLFYIELDGLAGNPVLNSDSPNLKLFNNIGGANWWSGTTFTIPELAWNFRFANGNQSANNKQAFSFLVWPVHTGDVFEPALDTDNDGVSDDVDNCTVISNPGQEDTDADLIGNRCDGDFNNDCIVNFPDFSLFPAEFLGTNPLFDLDGNGTVGFTDYFILSASFLQPPGPSAAGCN